MYVGRHAGPTPPTGPAVSPADLVGWAVFTVVLVVAVLVWADVPWPVVAAVGVTVVLALGSVAALARFGPGGRGRRRPPDGPSDPPRVP